MAVNIFQRRSLLSIWHGQTLRSVSSTCLLFHSIEESYAFLSGRSVFAIATDKHSHRQRLMLAARSQSRKSHAYVDSAFHLMRQMKGALMNFVWSRGWLGWLARSRRPNLIEWVRKKTARRRQSERPWRQQSRSIGATKDVSWLQLVVRVTREQVYRSKNAFACYQLEGNKPSMRVEGEKELTVYSCIDQCSMTKESGASTHVPAIVVGTSRSRWWKTNWSINAESHVTWCTYVIVLWTQAFGVNTRP